MTLSIDSGQMTLSKRTDVTCLPLVVLQTFTDRDASTVASTYYWTRGVPLKYQWNGATAVWFQPRLESVSPIVRGFPHIPNAGDFNTRETVRIVLDATERAGEFLWAVLTGENLIGARVTIASLLAAFDADDPRAFDLSALGDVHLVRWRGEVTLVPTMSDEDQSFELVCEAEETPLSWPRLVGSPRAGEQDVGRVLPVPVGDAVGIEALKFDPGAVDNLAAAITDVATSATVRGTTAKFRPTLCFTSVDTFGLIAIDDEIILWEETGTTASSFSFFGRGGFGTSAASHDEDAPIYEIPVEVRFAVSRFPIASLNAVRIFDGNGSQITIVDQRVFLQNHYAAAPDGAVALIAIEGTALSGAILSGRRGNGLLIRMEVDANGIYKVGASPTTLLDFDGSAASWSTIDGNHTFTDTISGVEIDSRAFSGWCYTIAEIAFTSADLSADELRFELDIAQAEIDKLVYIRFIVGPAGLSGSLGPEELYGDANVTYLAEDLIDGPQTIRLYGGNNKPGGATMTASDVFTVVVQHKVPDTVATFDLNGLLESYTVTERSSDPLDALEFTLEDILVTTGLTADATSFATAKANLSSVGFGGDLASGSAVLAEALARIGYECRTNLFRDDSGATTLIKASNAQSTLDFPAASRTIEEFSDLKVTPKQLTEIANRFTFLYNGTPGIAANLIESYRDSLLVNEGDNPFSADVPTADIDDSQAAYGARDSVPMPFSLLPDETSLQGVAAYYVQEAIDGARMRYSLVAPWWEAYDLEPGDIVEVTPRWKTSAVKLRVVQVSFNFREPGVGLNLEEVL